MRVRGGRREDRQDDSEYLAQAMCTAADHHPRCWAALCLTLGPLVSPKTVWMPIRQSTVMRPGLRLTTSQKKEEPSRVFPKPRHHAIAVVVATFARSQLAPRCGNRANTTREVEGRKTRTIPQFALYELEREDLPLYAFKSPLKFTAPVAPRSTRCNTACVLRLHRHGRRLRCP